MTALMVQILLSPVPVMDVGGNALLQACAGSGGQFEISGHELCAMIKPAHASHPFPLWETGGPSEPMLLN
jgi:hypothetical protein